MTHSGPIGATCAFCEEMAVYQCDWGVNDFVALRVRDLVIGDQVRRFNELKARRKATATVVELEDLVVVHAVNYNRTYHRRVVLRIDGKTERLKHFTESPYAAIRIKRDGRCRAPVCESHVQERAEERHVCMSHWSAWSEAA